MTIHKKGTIRLTTSEPPVLKGEKENMVKLWTISATDTTKHKQKVHNVYSLPSILHTIRYLYAMAGFLVKETWLDAILSRKLCHMAWTRNSGSAKTFPGFGQNTTRTYEEATSGSKINERTY